jgi:lysine decarboxylase
MKRIHNGRVTRKRNTPIYDEIKKYIQSGTLPFHMPGHKMGKGLGPDYVKNLARIDLTEIPGLDDLARPTGIIRQAEKLAAKAFAAKDTYFLVNGSTSGIYSIISTICSPGESLIVSRDCHKSVITGMMLAGVQPIFVMPEVDQYFGISSFITTESIKKALEENPSAKGVLLTCPNYYGICSDLTEISKLIHSRGKILAIDEAHGAHFAFNDKLPVPAIKAGADICVQSAHKTLPAFTQGAYVHVGSDRINQERLRSFLQIYQTSSPSYIIMSSLDIARDIMETEGSKYLDRLIAMIEQGKNSMGDYRCLILEPSSQKQGQDYILDPTRIVINVRKLGITAFEAERIIREKWGIQAEMSDLYNIVFITTVSDREDDIRRLFQSIIEMAQSLDAAKDKTQKEESLPMLGKDYSLELPIQAIKTNETLFAQYENLSIYEASGRVSKDIVAPYPPGTPILCPGELITDKIIDIILRIIRAGGTVYGVDEQLNIKVVK